VHLFGGKQVGFPFLKLACNVAAVSGSIPNIFIFLQKIAQRY